MGPQTLLESGVANTLGTCTNRAHILVVGVCVSVCVYMYIREYRYCTYTKYTDITYNRCVRHCMFVCGCISIDI